MKTSFHQNSYIAGFVFSLLLTLVAYLAIDRAWVHGWAAISVILFLALLQLVVQVVFFLHLGREPKPRWNLNVMLFAAMVAGILVGGSLWIMYNLDYHHAGHTQPSSTDSDIIKDESFDR